MDRKEDREILRKGGFDEREMNQLSRLRQDHNERVRREAAEDHRRLEFVRWLFITGKLSDQLVS